MADSGGDSASGDQSKAKSDVPKEVLEELSGGNDQELDDLLDSALADFDKPPVVPTDAVLPTADENPLQDEAAGDAALSPEALFNEIFDADMSGDAAKQFEEAMKSFMSQEPEMMKQFESLAQVAENAGDSEESQRHFAETMQSTLGSLSQNVQNMQGEVSEDDLTRAMASMGLDGQTGAMGEAGADFFPMMQGVMRGLLSKEVLYPSLKEIIGKYPQWLEDNKDTLDQEKIDNYRKQKDIMERICGEFDAETPDEDDEAKKQRFETILDLMQKMQEYGQPPSEIVKDMAPGLEFDEQGNPKLPGSSEQCSVM